MVDTKYVEVGKRRGWIGVQNFVLIKYADPRLVRARRNISGIQESTHFIRGGSMISKRHENVSNSKEIVQC